MIAGMFDHGALPVLERVTQFTEERHRVLGDNVANLSTPYYKPRDLNTGSFQAVLRDAIDQRRTRPNPTAGPLNVNNTRQLRFGKDGLETEPQPSHEGILFHDQNNRDLERTMQHLAENTLAHNMAIEMIRNQFSIMLTAIRERV